MIRLLLATAAVNVGLGFAIAGVLTRPLPGRLPAADARLQPVRTDLPESAQAAARPALDREMALGRPLFSPDRRAWQPPPPPPVVEVAAPQPEETVVADFVVAGLGVARGRAKAFLTDGNGEAIGWVAEGDTVMDWTVVAIAGRAVTFRQADREVAFELASDADF